VSSLRKDMNKSAAAAAAAAVDAQEEILNLKGDLGKQQREFDTEMIPAAASQAAAAEKIMLLESTLGRVHEESETAEGALYKQIAELTSTVTELKRNAKEASATAVQTEGGLQRRISELEHSLTEAECNTESAQQNAEASASARKAEAAEYDLVISKLREDLVLSVQASSMTETAAYAEICDLKGAISKLKLERESLAMDQAKAKQEKEMAEAHSKAVKVAAAEEKEHLEAEIGRLQSKLSAAAQEETEARLRTLERMSELQREVGVLRHANEEVMSLMKELKASSEAASREGIAKMQNGISFTVQHLETSCASLQAEKSACEAQIRQLEAELESTKAAIERMQQWALSYRQKCINVAASSRNYRRQALAKAFWGMCQGFCDACWAGELTRVGGTWLRVSESNFRQLDVNGDGMIDHTEWRAAELRAASATSNSVNSVSPWGMGQQSASPTTPAGLQRYHTPGSQRYHTPHSAWAGTPIAGSDGVDPTVPTVDDTEQRWQTKSMPARSLDSKAFLQRAQVDSVQTELRDQEKMLAVADAEQRWQAKLMAARELVETIKR